jgi:hypothetical protein
MEIIKIVENIIQTAKYIDVELEEIQITHKIYFEK